MGTNKRKTVRRSVRSFWARLSIPMGILLVEVASLTPFVEFNDDRMAWVANSAVFSGGMVGLMVFVLLTSRKVVLLGAPFGRGRVTESTFWFCAHLILYLLFVNDTLDLTKLAGNAVATKDALAWREPVAWSLLAIAVATTVCLAFLPLRRFREWFRQCSPQLGGAIAAGTVMALLVPVIRRMWLHVDPAAVIVTGWLLDWFPGDAVAEWHSNSNPIVGTQRMRLEVTRHCSEMESLLAFWLLWGSVLVARWKETRKLRFIALLLLGTELLYLLNAIRLYGLVLFGLRFGSDACVNLAHSRVGGILFFVFSVCLLTAGSRFCVRTGGNRGQ